MKTMIFSTSIFQSPLLQIAVAALIGIVLSTTLSYWATERRLKKGAKRVLATKQRIIDDYEMIYSLELTALWGDWLSKIQHAQEGLGKSLISGLFTEAGDNRLCLLSLKNRPYCEDLVIEISNILGWKNDHDLEVTKWLKKVARVYIDIILTESTNSAPLYRDILSEIKNLSADCPII